MNRYPSFRVKRVKVFTEICALKIAFINLLSKYLNIYNTLKISFKNVMPFSEIY